MNTVVVTYQVRPEAKEEHVALIQAVFEQLSSEGPGDVSYEVICLADGVSFIHVSTAETDDGTNPLVAMSAFQDFSRDVTERTVQPPVASSADLLGSYRPSPAPGRAT
jgi:hypothetical protein